MTKSIRHETKIVLENNCQLLLLATMCLIYSLTGYCELTQKNKLLGQVSELNQWTDQDKVFFSE